LFNEVRKLRSERNELQKQYQHDERQQEEEEDQQTQQLIIL